MEWLRAILGGAKVTDGVLDAESLLSAIQKEFPKHAVPKAQFNEVNEKLKAAGATIEKMKKDNQDNEALQQEVNNYKAKVKDLETAAQNAQREYALKDQLKAAGVTDADYVIYKQGGLDQFPFDKDGKPVGVEEMLNPLRDSSPHLFAAEKKGGYEPKGGGKPAENNPFAKDTYNMTEQGRLLREDPDQARRLAAAAGVKL